MKVDENIENQSSKMVPEEKEPSSFRLIFTLGLAGFLSGLILVVAYLYTKPFIEANKAAAIEKAIYKVLPNCSSFKTFTLKDGLIAEYDPASKKENKKGEEPKFIYLGYNKSDELIGFAFVGAQAGFQDIIAIMIGYDANKKQIIGYEVLECKETPGLGDKIIKDIAFQNNFVALSTEPEVKFAKKGEKQNANEVEGITGATISSKAVVRILNGAITEWTQAIDNYLKALNTKGS